MENLVSELKDWAKKPYSEEGNVIDWFLFIGLMTAATILWTRVIRRLVD